MKPYLPIAFLTIILFATQICLSQTKLWSKTLTDPSGFEAMSRLSSGEYLICGNYRSPGVPFTAVFDKDGNELLEKKLCENCIIDEQSMFITELKDGRILLITNRFKLYILNSVSLDIDSIIDLSKVSGYSEILNKVQKLNDALILVGYYYDGNGKSGNIWTYFDLQTLKITSQVIDKQTPIISTFTNSNDSELIACFYNQQNFTIQKLNKANKIVWQKQFKEGYTQINDIILSKDNKILILGEKLDTIINSFLLALNINGDSLWEKTYEYNPMRIDHYSFNHFKRIKETLDNNLILIGTIGTFANIFSPFEFDLMKVSSTGNFIWEHKERIIEEGTEAYDLLFDEDNNIIAVGTTGLTDYEDPNRAFIMKLTNPLVDTKQVDADQIRIYPNPCLDKIIIQNSRMDKKLNQLEVFNAEGFCLIKRNFYNTELNLNTGELTPGVYFCKLSSSNESFVEKFIKE